MSTFEDFATAIRMRSLMKGIIKEEVDYLRPADKFGIVYSIDSTTNTAQVILDGDDVPIRARYDVNNAPISSQLVPHYGYDNGDANRVRVTGGPGGYWITQIVRGHSSVGVYNTQPGFRNFFVNGACDVAQRGNGPFTAAGYCTDQWNKWVGGAASISVTRQTHTPGAFTDGARYYNEFTVTNSSAAGDYAVFAMYVEDVYKLAGQVVTLSFDAWASSGTPSIGIECIQNFGSGGSTVVQTPIKAVTIKQNVVDRYYVTFVVPSISGKTVSAGLDTNTVIYFWLSAGSTYNTRASYIGHQNNTFRVTKVQLELGPVATPFENLPVDVTLARCKRYLSVDGPANGGGTVYAWGPAYNQAGVWMHFVLPVEMRDYPSVSFNGTYQISDGSSGWTCDGIQVTTSSSRRLLLLNTWIGTNSLTVGRYYYLQTTGGASGTLTFSSEF